MPDTYKELTVENNVKIRPDSFWDSKNEAINGSKGHLQLNSFITPDKCINFKFNQHEDLKRTIEINLN